MKKIIILIFAITLTSCGSSQWMTTTNNRPTKEQQEKIVERNKTLTANFR